MPISRPLLLALVGAVLIGAALLVTRGGGDEAATTTASVTPTPPQAPGKERAEEPARGASRSQARRGADPPPAMPRDVKLALARDKVAVILLYQPGAADDEATLRQVRELDLARSRSGGLRKRSAIFTAPLSDAADYLGVTGALGVSRAPAIAVMEPEGEVRLVEGYTDGRSLRQHLTDALP